MGLPIWRAWLLLAVAWPSAADVAAPTPTTSATPSLAALLQARADFEVSSMLMGAVTFVMALFYVLNHNDDDIRGYSWSVMSNSIVMFLGVLLGTSWNGVVSFYLLPPPDQMSVWRPIAVDAWTMLGWYLVLQTALAYICGCIGRKPTSSVQTVLNLKCWAVLIGIICAATNLLLWGLIQEQAPPTIAGTSSVILAAAALLGSLFKLSDWVRRVVSLWDDGKEDEYERMWKKYTSEAEDNAMCLTVAHLVVQVVRFYLSGCLPLANGAINPKATLTNSATRGLLLCGLLFAVCIPLTDLLMPSCLGRAKTWLKKSVANCVAFCVLYGTDWLLAATLGNGALGTMLLALLVTGIAFIIIFVLDFIADLDCTGERIDEELRALVQPLSVLIGFAWKQAFAVSLTTITSTERFAPAALEAMAMAAILAVIVVPAWRWYILPIVMHDEVLETEKKFRKSLRQEPLPNLNLIAAKQPLLAVESFQNAPKPSFQVANGEVDGHHGHHRPVHFVEEAPVEVAVEELMERNRLLELRNRDLEAVLNATSQELQLLRNLVDELSIGV